MGLPLAALWIASIASALEIESNYRVPVTDKALQSEATFKLDDAKILNLQNRIETLYSIPEDLTGDKPRLRVRLVSGMTNEFLEQMPSFPSRGIIAAAPCRWPGEEDSRKGEPECPTDPNDEKVRGIAKSRCFWVKPSNKAQSDLRCHVEYSTISEIVDENAHEKFLREKLAAEPRRVEPLLQIAQVFFHDAVGQVYFKR